MKVLVIAPHPDDEALGCGGAIRLHANAGDEVYALYLTSGELGSPGEDQTATAQRREDEARRAAGELGISGLRFWRLPDTRVSADEPCQNRLRLLLEDLCPDLIYAPHGGESHPDHRAAADLTASVADARTVRTYEVWTPLAQFMAVVDITAVAGIKRSAIRCHQSQLWSGFDEAMLSLNHYRGLMHGPGMLYAEVFGML